MIYYNYTEKKIDTDVENKIIDIFNENRKVYGTRKIKNKLILTVSRRKIGEIMEKYGLVSKYTLKRYNHHKTSVNNSEIGNVLNR